MDKDKFWETCEKVLVQIAVCTLITYVVKGIVKFIKKFTNKENTLDELFEEKEDA